MPARERRMRPATAVGEHGTISTTKKEGKWTSRTRLRSPGDGRLVSVSATAATKAAAIRKLEGKLKGHTHTSGETGVTVQMAVERFLAFAELEGARQEITMQIYRNAADKQIIPQLGAFQVSQLSRQRASRFILEMHQSNPGNASNSRTVLSLALGYAANNGWCDSNVLLGAIRLPAKARKNPVVFSPEQIDEAIYWADKHTASPIGLYVRVALASGGRVGEVLGLRFQDFIPAAGGLPAAVVFRGSVIETKRYGVQRRPQLKGKLPGESRGVEISPAVAASIQFQIDSLAHEGLVGPDTPVFPNQARDGGHLSPHNLRRTWARVRGKLSDPELRKLSTHAFRKTFATQASSMYGFELTAALLGHSDTSMLTKHYLARTELQNLAPVMRVGELRAEIES
jgi:integrase